MTCMRATVTGVAAGVIGMAVAGAAFAQPASPVVRWAQMTSGPGEFYLNSQEEREVVRYTTPRDVRLCLPMGDPGVGRDVPETPLRVAWDGSEVVLHPGNCLFFDARRVMVSPAAALPQGAVIHGMVETAPIR